MNPKRPPRGSRRAGFTLVETLVALVVFAVVAAVAQRGMVTTRLGLDRVRSTLAAEQVARSIVETELDRLVRAPGEFSGETDGLAWTISAAPLPIATPQPPAQQRPGSAAAPTRTGQSAPAGQDVDQTGKNDTNDEVDEHQWRALRVIVTVANGRGRPLRVETVQTVKIVE